MKRVILTMALCLGLTLTQSQLFYIQKHWVNEDTKMVTILVDESIVGGTDGQCETAGKLFHSICSQGYELYVISPTGWVPSAKNPMTVDWTINLID
jgi:hypothetical protein